MKEEDIKRSIPWNFFYPRMAIIELEAGESKEDAWLRHLRRNPHDDRVKIRIFHQNTTIQQVNHDSCGGEHRK